MKVNSVLIAVILIMLLLCPVCEAQTVNSYNVFDQDSLFNMTRDPYGEYFITENIVLSGVHKTMFASKDQPFYGILDGGGHTITYLNIEGDDDVMAFIGFLKGTIKNVNFLCASVKSNRSDAVLGGIVAFNYGEIVDCSFSGDLEKAGKVPYLCGINTYNIGQKIRCTEVITNSGEVNQYSSETVYSDIESFYSDNESDIPSNEISSESSVSTVSSSSRSEVSSKVDRVDSSRPTTEQYYTDTVSDSKPTDNGKAGNLMVGIFGLGLLSMISYIVYQEIKETVEHRKRKIKSSEK